jgi:hypothetical protein
MLTKDVNLPPFGKFGGKGATVLRRGQKRSSGDFELFQTTDYEKVSNDQKHESAWTIPETRPENKVIPLLIFRELSRKHFLQRANCGFACSIRFVRESTTLLFTNSGFGARHHTFRLSTTVQYIKSGMKCEIALIRESFQSAHHQLSEQVLDIQTHTNNIWRLEQTISDVRARITQMNI